MFAGRMKLRTFVILAGLGGGALCAGIAGAYLIFVPVAPPDPPAAVIAVADEAPVGAAETPTPVAAAKAPSGPGMRAEDEIALSYLGRDIGSDKLKDVSKGRTFKVNVYQDAGNSTANRVKIDLDRDDKWDEKLDFKPEGVIRQVAPNDDEQYTETYRLVDGAWVKG